jgi:DNA-binding response OmpR family regulator
MAEDKEPQLKALIVAPESGDRGPLEEFLAQNGFKVFCRDSRLRSFQLLTITQVDVIIVAGDVADAKAIDFCRDFRSDAGFQTVPLLIIDEDNDTGSVCVEAFEAGADDFIDAPFIPNVLMARIKRFLRKKAKTGVSSSLSVQISGGELPGVLTFLEAETKTGRLSIKSNDKTAVIYLKEGRLANGKAPNCEGLDAIVEALCWPTSHVTFEESEIGEEEVKFSMETTGTIMNCVFEVDEFAEAKGAMPDQNAMLVPGDNKLPPDVQELQKKVFEMAVTGNSIDTITHDPGLSERRATMALHWLFEGGHLIATNPPFHDYTNRCYDQYKKSGGFFESRLTEISKVLSNVKFPLPELPPKLTLSSIDWMTPAPKVLITGDNPDHVSILIRSLADIATVLNNRKPPTRTVHKGIKVTRLYLDERLILDVLALPPAFSKHVLGALDECLIDCCGTIILGSSQTGKAIRNNMRTLRQLRQRFQGVYCCVAPQVANRHEKYEFRMDCENCGYTLSVDMAQQGAMGECPICNKTLTIPDSLDHLAHKLNLPDDVPIVQVQPVSHKHCRDLLVFLIGSIVKACNPPEQAQAEAEFAQPQMLPAASEVRERATPSQRDEYIAALPTQADETLPNNLDALGTVLATETTKNPAADPLDAIIDTDDDEFDIDDFIAKVQGISKD